MLVLAIVFVRTCASANARSEIDKAVHQQRVEPRWGEGFGAGRIQLQGFLKLVFITRNEFSILDPVVNPPLYAPGKVLILQMHVHATRGRRSVMSESV